MIIPDLDVQTWIHRIHAAGPDAARFVISLSGGGTSAISELLRYGNGSNTLLAQHCLYDNHAFDKYVKGTPDKYVSERSARALAMSAYMEALSYISADSVFPVMGIGCTSSLAKAGEEREGREHWIHVALQDDMNTRVISLQLDSALKRKRTAEEDINALIILWVIASCRDVDCPFGEIVLKTLLTQTDITTRTANYNPRKEISTVLHSKGSSWSSYDMTPSPHLILSGSFNPLHDGHKKMMEFGRKFTSLPGIYEMSISNVDKSPLDFIEIEQREKQFKAAGIEPLLITNSPKFVSKAMLVPKGSVFAMGADTFSRLIGADDERLALPRTFNDYGIKFLVFARKCGDKIVTANDLMATSPVESQWSDIVTPVPIEAFSMDISSSAIRKASL